MGVEMEGMYEPWSMRILSGVGLDLVGFTIVFNTLLSLFFSGVREQ